MKLTKQQALDGHRKMWNWIADVIEKEKKFLLIKELKKEYCRKNNLHLTEDCFCCEYDNQHFDTCEQCPVSWEDSCSVPCIPLFRLVLETTDWHEQAKIARQIANLKERKELKKK